MPNPKGGTPKAGARKKRKTRDVSRSGAAGGVGPANRDTIPSNRGGDDDGDLSFSARQVAWMREQGMLGHHQAPKRGITR